MNQLKQDLLIKSKILQSYHSMSGLLILSQSKDSGALTVLSQDHVGGLEVKRKADGEWIPVKPTSNAYIISVGDILQVWSNDRYESVEHRAVVNTEKERFSIPFFINPAHYTLVMPLEELTDEQNPAKYKPYNWKHPGFSFQGRRIAPSS